MIGNAIITDEAIRITCVYGALWMFRILQAISVRAAAEPFGDVYGSDDCLNERKELQFK